MRSLFVDSDGSVGPHHGLLEIGEREGFLARVGTVGFEKHRKVTSRGADSFIARRLVLFGRMISENVFDLFFGHGCSLAQSMVIINAL